MSALLLKVANDAPRWIAWMRVFNGYPVRYPVLQMPLGHALADMPQAAVEAYVDAIVLNVKATRPDPNRQSVAACLRAFRTKATVARQSGWKRCGEQDGQFGGRGEEMIVVPRQ